MKYSMDIFSRSSIEKLRKDLVEYRNDLQKKCEEFIKRLSESGYEVALKNINESPLGKMVTLENQISSDTSGCKAVLIAKGTTLRHEGTPDFNVLLAIEFGAGIHYNSKGNPEAEKFGLGVGTFPGQVHAFEDGWYFVGNDGKLHYTHGVKATMPMYSAYAEMIDRFEEIAKEVFT